MCSAAGGSAEAWIVGTRFVEIKWWWTIRMCWNWNYSRQRGRGLTNREGSETHQNYVTSIFPREKGYIVIRRAACTRFWHAICKGFIDDYYRTTTNIIEILYKYDGNRTLAHRNTPGWKTAVGLRVWEALITWVFRLEFVLRRIYNVEFRGVFSQMVAPPRPSAMTRFGRGQRHRWVDPTQ